VALVQPFSKRTRVVLASFTLVLMHKHAARGEYELVRLVIEAPWLVNGGHGASLRHHKAPRPATDLVSSTVTTSPTSRIPTWSDEQCNKNKRRGISVTATIIIMGILCSRNCVDTSGNLSRGLGYRSWAAAAAMLLRRRG
jgi:hypothetical protein